MSAQATRLLIHASPHMVQDVRDAARLLSNESIPVGAVDDDPAMTYAPAYAAVASMLDRLADALDASFVSPPQPPADIHM